MNHISTRPWQRGNIKLNHSTPLWFHYGNTQVGGSVRDGKLHADGIGSFDYPSPAIAAVVMHETGEPISLNGWLHISAQLSEGTWVSLDTLRRNLASMRTMKISAPVYNGTENATDISVGP